MTGLHLSHYAIESELGRGGMGIVFRAKDTKLNRTVALKVLPAGALASEDDRARFRREAQASAQLNHPNVCHVYQVDEAQPLSPDGKPVEGQIEPRLFIAMEYIEGQTLHDYVKKGPLKLQEAVNIAGQVAEALKAAHAKDIVHRDIKSANVMLAPDGVAKVLDFGLAKTNQSTMLTRQGSTLGTVAYMSPEQARGEEVDGRSDLYSLGTVLYEMVAGRLPFGGDYEQAVLYGILNETPEPLTAVRTGVPMQLEWIVTKLLAKEARHRYQTAPDLIADLETIDLSGSGFSRQSITAVAPAAALPRRMMFVALAALAAGAAVGAGATMMMPGPEPQRTTVKRFDVPLSEGSGQRVPIIAPDGSRIAVLDPVQGEATIIDLSSGVSHRLERQGVGGIDFSPDGQQLLISGLEGVERARSDGSDRIPVIGGFAHAGIAFASWGPSGEVVYATGSSFFVTLPPAGVPDTTHVELGSMVLPVDLLPDGRVVLSIASLRDSQRATWAFDLVNGRMQRIGDFVAKVLPTGHSIVSDGEFGAHQLIPIDPESFEPVGPAVALEFLDGTFWDVASDGTLVYQPRPAALSDRQDLRVLRADGTDELIAPDVGAAFDVTSTGERVVLSLPSSDDSRDRGYQLTVVDVRSGLQTRIGGGAWIRNVRWHPSEREVTGQSETRDAILATPADRSAAPRQIVPSWGGEMGAVSWTADGSRMIWSRHSTDGDFATGVALYDVEADSSWWIGDPEGFQLHPDVTGDGRFVAYTKVGTDFSEAVAVIEVETERNWLLPKEPGWGSHRWSADGTGLEILAGDSLLSIPTEFEPTFRVTGRPEVIAILPGMRSAKRLYNRDVFYTRTVETPSQDEEETAVLKVIVNWFEEVKRLAPHPR